MSEANWYELAKDVRGVRRVARMRCPFHGVELARTVLVGVESFVCTSRSCRRTYSRHDIQEAEKVVQEIAGYMEEP